jgi:hypothetical protein
MVYTKPEIAVLGDAREVIAQNQGKPGGSVDSRTGPAYDLDE